MIWNYTSYILATVAADIKAKRFTTQFVLVALGICKKAEKIADLVDVYRDAGINAC